ncbi:asparagine synthase-related protein [Pricia sp. S334]|uniref:asparagine synthase (glutamine-hydrolyzing) n=1 Tax=Pricia mediterranea TaxID=3076079 RepID=A0ABU3LAF4_9FLAO|nr:asparagine synthase-related protein [Pricia sp. S334]MDT7830213.1 asparagine synthase-related protein [Pricia sp. S334]
MSKIIYINFSNEVDQRSYSKLAQISKTLEPDNIDPNPPKIYQGHRTLYSIVNPVGTITTKDESILLGHCVCQNNWYSPLNPVEDGSYALIRSDQEMTEVVADSVGSRALWYFKNKEIFIVATSQRAIILFLESFEFNEKIIPWMLSTGTLGPDFSWDKRITKLKPDSRIIVYKEDWKLEEKNNEIVISESKRSYKEHKKKLYNAIQTSFKNFAFDLEKWVLPLSGGHDSRAILYLINNALQNPGKIRSITWGLAQSIHQKGNDAFVAKKVAEATGVQHKYYHTDMSNNSAQTILKRFIENGEGRIDHISGYADGFAIWKTLFEDGVDGIIRGDEGFGWVTAASPLRIRYHLGCALCTDYSNLSDYRKYGIPEQVNPEYMKQKESESLYAWRDRVYHRYRIPTVLSALSDLKLGYIEQSTPLLADQIIRTVRTLPDRLRTEKSLFKEIMHDFKPKLEYATKSATSAPMNILKSGEMVSYLRKELKSEEAMRIFSPEFLHMILENSVVSKGESTKTSFRLKLKLLFIKYAPQYIKNRISSNRKLAVDSNILLFRVYIIIHMHRLLSK